MAERDLAQPDSLTPRNHAERARTTDPDLSCLGKAASQVSAGRAEHSGVYALQIAQEAFAARALLARAAERTLDVQCYIWHADTTGFLLLEELWNAAERGVRVRVLLDDNGIAGLDQTLAALDSHANIQVRLFNPFPNRRFKALGYLTDFRRLNRRMHNKSFTADGAATILGGRNVGDEYFGAGQRMVFADLDVLAMGPIASEVATAFEQYWNYDAARPLDAIVGPARPGAVATLRARFAAARASASSAAYVEALCSVPLVEALLAHEWRLERAGVRLLCDPPSKVKDRAPRSDLVFANLRDALGTPERAIDLVSPYFVPGRKGTRALARFARHGIAVRVLTNSLAATDVAAVHAGYAKRRRSLLRSGVSLFELKPDGAARHRRAGVRLGGSSMASLHAKTFSVDRTRVFVGSLNLDPRSIRLNTEMGLVIESSRLADAVANELDDALADAAYEVVLAPPGRIEWVERIADAEVRHRAEPKTSWLKRLGVRLVALLPVEELL